VQSRKEEANIAKLGTDCPTSIDTSGSPGEFLEGSMAGLELTLSDRERARRVSDGFRP
jgi:hypothetical protein